MLRICHLQRVDLSTEVSYAHVNMVFFGMNDLPERREFEIFERLKYRFVSHNVTVCVLWRFRLGEGWEELLICWYRDSYLAGEDGEGEGRRRTDGGNQTTMQ